MPLKLWFCLDSKQDPSFFLLVKFPVEHGRQGLGFRRIQRMMEQVIESSITKAGLALGVPGEVSHNHLRELLPRLQPVPKFLFVPWWQPNTGDLKTLCLMVKGRKAMTLDLRVLGPAPKAIEELDCTTWSYMWLLPAILSSASLGASRTAVLPLCTSISMPAESKSLSLPVWFFFASGNWHNTPLVLFHASLDLKVFRCLSLSRKVSRTSLCTAVAVSCYGFCTFHWGSVGAALGSFSCL